MDSLSIAQAQKLVLLSQGLPARRRPAHRGPLTALEHLGYVQIDTISVVERAHHHVLWSRDGRYRPGDIERLVERKEAFEYWSHAAAYLPMRDFRFSLPRKAAIGRGELDHWYPREPRQMREVLARIRAEGPLRARDFEHDSRHRKPGEWHHKPAKRALNYLFMQGELMCARREGFEMVYDLRERVLPAGVDCRHPSDAEFAQHLIEGYLRANGLGQLRDIAYLRKGIKPLLATRAQEMLEAGELQQLRVKQQTYLALAGQRQLLEQRLPRSRACILSPFDNLLIQRHRMRELFDFDYQIECYTPAAKRRYGYFVLPVLWRARFAARLDCRVDRRRRTLKLVALHRELDPRRDDDLAAALAPALRDFASFNGADEILAGELPDSALARALRGQLRD